MHNRPMWSSWISPCVNVLAQVLRQIAESFDLQYYLVKSTLATDLIMHLRKR
jgi:hypothetical protein